MRLIDADKLSARLSRNATPYFTVPDIENAPTIDAVPVVRCWECKQGEVDDQDFPDQYYCHDGCGWNKGDFYCAYGERKEGVD